MMTAATTIFRPALLAAFGAAAIFSAPAFADAGKSMTVRHTDLNLADAAGAATLEARVRRAAAHVCGDADNRDLPAIADMHACRAAAIANAAPQVQTALAAARGGQAYAEAGVRVAAGR